MWGIWPLSSVLFRITSLQQFHCKVKLSKVKGSVWVGYWSFLTLPLTLCPANFTVPGVRCWWHICHLFAFPKAFLERGFLYSRFMSPYFLNIFLVHFDISINLLSQVDMEVPFLNIKSRHYSSAPNTASKRFCHMIIFLTIFTSKYSNCSTVPVPGDFFFLCVLKITVKSIQFLPFPLESSLPAIGTCVTSYLHTVCRTLSLSNHSRTLTSLAGLLYHVYIRSGDVQGQVYAGLFLCLLVQILNKYIFPEKASNSPFYPQSLPSVNMRNGKQNQGLYTHGKINLWTVIYIYIYFISQTV